MPDFSISQLSAGSGWIGLCPVPGCAGDYAADLAQLLDWAPQVVLSLTVQHELEQAGAAGLPQDLARAGCTVLQIPVRDFGHPNADALKLWPEASATILSVLATGGRVLAHCKGGCGRSGMAILSILVESGEEPAIALARLRAVRPCAVETQAQLHWASTGAPGPASSC